MVTVLVPHVGGPILPPGVPTVLIGMLPAATVTDMLTCVGPPDVIVMGSLGVLINYLPAARLGDPTAHGGVIVLGEPTVMIGEMGAPSPGAAGMAAIIAGMVVAGLIRSIVANASELSGPGAGAATVGGLPAKPPKDCASAPETVQIPQNVNDTFNSLMKNSFPNGKSQEQGGLIVSDSKGALSVINQHSGNSGSFVPDRTLPPGDKKVGLFHTHPYDASEGGYTGVSFSGADIAIAADNSEPSYVQSGDKQFLMLPTAATPKNLDADALNKSQNKRIGELTKAGFPFDQASRIAANETAQKYGFAYYQGSNGTLTKVSC
jgi:uncharacterized Zn-binding protein involved in type VI secretion